MATIAELEAQIESRRAYNRNRRLRREAALGARTPSECLADAVKRHPNMEKVCQRCRLSQPFACFSIKPNQEDGLSFLCDDCWAERDAEDAR